MVSKNDEGKRTALYKQVGIFRVRVGCKAYGEHGYTGIHPRVCMCNHCVRDVAGWDAYDEYVVNGNSQNYRDLVALAKSITDEVAKGKSVICAAHYRACGENDVCQDCGKVPMHITETRVIVAKQERGASPSPIPCDQSIGHGKNCEKTATCKMGQMNYCQEHYEAKQTKTGGV